MRRVFVDSSAWIALHSTRHQNHAAAVAALRSLQDEPIRVVTSDYVVDEALTLIRMRSSHASAVEFGQTVLSHDLVEWADVSGALWLAAWDIFVRSDDKELSFTDCTSFAIMWANTIREALAFDTDFERVGFQLVP